jgi:hypothetical protein
MVKCCQFTDGDALAAQSFELLHLPQALQATALLLQPPLPRLCFVQLVEEAGDCRPHGHVSFPLCCHITALVNLILLLQVCACHWRPTEDWLPVLSEAAALRCPPHRHDALPRGCCQAIPAGGRQRALAQSIACVWVGLQGHWGARALLFVCDQVLSLTSHHSQQRVSDGAAATCVLCLAGRGRDVEMGCDE